MAFFKNVQRDKKEKESEINYKKEGYVQLVVQDGVRFRKMLMLISKSWLYSAGSKETPFREQSNSNTELVLGHTTWKRYHKNINNSC